MMATWTQAAQLHNIYIYIYICMYIYIYIHTVYINVHRLYSTIMRKSHHKLTVKV